MATSRRTCTAVPRAAAPVGLGGHVGTPRSLQGLTLIEMMIVLVVLGVTLAIAVPNFNSLIRNVWATGRANEFVSAFNIARSEAITRSSTVTLCASDAPMAANPDCSGDGTAWANGWIVFENTNGDLTVDNNDTVIQVSEGLEDGITLAEANDRAAVHYGSRGGVNQSMSFTLEPTDECSGNGSRLIAVALVGRTDVTQQSCQNP